MRFTLFNLLIVNALVALLLGFMLSDETKINANALELQSDLRYIAASEAWHSTPIDPSERLPKNRDLLFYCK